MKYKKLFIIGILLLVLPLMMGQVEKLIFERKEPILKIGKRY